MQDKETVNNNAHNSALPGWKRWLNYQSVVKQIPFFLFLALLSVIYIYNGHHANKTLRAISRTSREVRDLQFEYKTLKSEVMFRSKQSELAKAVENLGLQQLNVAPAVLSNQTKPASKGNE
ncbi:MAG: FtsL-like putative cell division protein [Chitinophagaceae bacterium]